MILVIGAYLGSGKSLLRRLCNSHPQVEITDEFYCFFRVNVSYTEHISGLRKDWGRFPLVGERTAPAIQKHTQNARFLMHYFLKLQEYRQGLIQAEHVELILRHIFPHATIVGDVGPRYLFYSLDHLVDSPAFLPIIIFRDCRDIAGHIISRASKASWMKKMLGTPQQIAEKWVHSIEIMEQYSNRAFTIQYEDLVTNPQKVMAEFGQILNVTAQGFATQTVHTNDIGNYKKWLSDEDIVTILKIAGPTMERLGYKI